jgi:hypothetical protein
MMRQFLEQYVNASNLENQQYDCYFDQGIDRADFLLFDNQIVCEFKEFQNIKVQHQVEKLARKGNISDQNFKRDFYNSINIALSKSNGQIEESRIALHCSSALGLIILENQIHSDLSILSLIDAANRKMLSGLKSVDGILCMDMVNTFSNADAKPFRPAQLLLRDTERSARLSLLLKPLIEDFCTYSNIPMYDGLTIAKGNQVWQTNENGKYYKYEAKFDGQVPTLENKVDWRNQLAKFINKWWWIIPLLAILYDWFIP